MNDNGGGATKVADERSSEERAFDKGVEASELAATLKGHDIHLDKINGSQADMATSLKKVEGCMDQILDKMNDQKILEEEREKVRIAAEEERKEHEVDKREFRKWAVVLTVTIVIALLGPTVGPVIAQAISRALGGG